MEQNPFAQSSSQSVPPTHDKKKVYISILIILILLLSMMFLVRNFGAFKTQKMKKDIVEQLSHNEEPTIKENVEFSKEFSTRAKNSTATNESAKEELIKRLK